MPNPPPYNHDADGEALAEDLAAAPRIVRITYGESRTIPHPRKQFANRKPHVEITVEASVPMSAEAATGDLEDPSFYGIMSELKAKAAVELDAIAGEWIADIQRNKGSREETRERLESEISTRRAELDDLEEIPF